MTGCIGPEFRYDAACSLLPVGDQDFCGGGQKDKVQKIAACPLPKPYLEQLFRSAVPQDGVSLPVEQIGRRRDRVDERLEALWKRGGRMIFFDRIGSACDFEEVHALGQG